MTTTTNTAEATTIYTKVHSLMAGDVVFCAEGDLTVDTIFIDEGFGTWVYFTNGERESFPGDFGVYRVLPA